MNLVIEDYPILMRISIAFFGNTSTGCNWPKCALTLVDAM